MRPFMAATVQRRFFTVGLHHPDVNPIATFDAESPCFPCRSRVERYQRSRGLYLGAGKCLATTAAEVMVELKPPPQRLFDDSAPAAGRANYLRFRLSHNSAVALAARVKRTPRYKCADLLGEVTKTG